MRTHGLCTLATSAVAARGREGSLARGAWRGNEACGTTVVACLALLTHPYRRPR